MKTRYWELVVYLTLMMALFLLLNGLFALLAGDASVTFPMRNILTALFSWFI